MYDITIIGAGPAGISAGLYTKRANLSTLIIYKKESNLEKAENIQNYYGFKNGINGKDLYEDGIEQAKNIGIELLEEEVVEIQKQENIFLIKTTKNEIQTKAVILSTGNKKKTPQIEGITEFEGKGISYCAICDGFFYTGKNVAVLGNGNYAINETMELQNIAKTVTILTNGKEEPQYRAENVNVNSKTIKKIDGDKTVEKVDFQDGSQIDVSAVFVAEGVAGSSDFAKKIGAITEKDKIVVDENMKTNIKGLYACGDCTGGLLQVAKAVYEGAKAGLQAIDYVRKEDF